MAAVTNLLPTDITITQVSDQTRRLLRHAGERGLLAASVLITTKINIILETHGGEGTNGAALYNSIASAFTGSVSSGQFGAQLEIESTRVGLGGALTVDDLFPPAVGPSTLEAKRTAYPSPSPTAQPPDSGGGFSVGGLGAGPSAGVVVVILLAGGGFLAAMGYLLYRGIKRSQVVTIYVVPQPQKGEMNT
jgi:hypothetical protein